jgi:uncharacterized membrane protein YphA (DoxX/SURF4 family)
MELPRPLADVDVRVTEWMARYGITLTRLALGIVFLWFGVLKFVPGLSPAYELAGRTIETLTLGWIVPSISLPLLAFWECAIGLGLLLGRFLRATLLLLFLQMPGTMLPVVLFPGEVFQQVPFVPTLEGQYIIKNLVLIGAALVVGATVRGGRMIADPAQLRPRRPHGPRTRPAA